MITKHSLGMDIDLNENVVNNNTRFARRSLRAQSAYKRGVDWPEVRNMIHNGG